MCEELIWNSMDDIQKREVLDQFIMTSDIPSNIEWDKLDYGTKSAICITGALTPYVHTKM